MSNLKYSIRQLDPSLQALIEKIERASSLSLIIVTAWELACWLSVKIVEEILSERTHQKTDWGSCPECGCRLESKGFAPRQMTTFMGIIKWHRRLGRCPQRCCIGQVAPLDEELGLESNQRTDVNLKRKACLLAIFVPFETATLLLTQLVGVTISPASIWQWVQKAGQQMHTWLENELQALKEGHFEDRESLSSEALAQPLLIGADGIMVPFRPQNGTPQGKTRWREVKVGILARLGQHRTRRGERVDRLQQRRLVAVLGNIETFAEHLWLEALRQHIQASQCVVWLSDGASGFWGLFEARFALYALGVLDFYHAAQNLWKGVKVWRDGRTTSAREWFIKARHRLRHGEAEAVIDDIAQAKATPDLPEAAQKALSQLHTYLDKHREHINYQRLKDMGLPIGSGLVESACKWLIQQRFKGVGMRWSEDGFNALLLLRLAWINGRFEALFPLESASPKF